MPAELPRTVKVLHQVWVVAGQPCGKYLAAVMGTTLANMEAHIGSEAFGRARSRYSPLVHQQLLAMSAATIDRLLAPFKLSMYPDGKSTTRARRNQYTEALPIMFRIPDIDWQPGLVAIDTVAHCGNSAKGQYAVTPFSGASEAARMPAPVRSQGKQVTCDFLWRFLMEMGVGWKNETMSAGRDYESYAAKMRQHVRAGTDMEVDVRFVDMMTKRRSRVLDIGCGIGNAVNGLRARGHEAYGIDPTPQVLEVAGEFYDPSWFRRMTAGDIVPGTLALNGLPQAYDAVLMSGNVPAFLSANELRKIFGQVAGLLDDGGVFVVGTTTAIQGGPVDLDNAAARSSLTLAHRFSDWHLSPFYTESPWSVSVFSATGSREFAEVPGGMFALRG